MFHEGPAKYIDPNLPEKGFPIIPLIKHYRYTYQNEYRLCWVPTVYSNKLTYADLQIGSLESEAELIVLDG